MNTDLLAMEPLLLDTFTVIILQFTLKKLQDIEPSSSNNKSLLSLLYARYIYHLTIFTIIL